MSTSKVVAKAMLKRKNNGKDDRPNKKGTGPPFDDKQPKHPWPPKPSHGFGKGLMMGKGPVILGAVRKLLTHKDYIVEMVDSIVKETNLDPCADQTTEDLGVYGFYDLSKVCSTQVMVLCTLYSFFL